MAAINSVSIVPVATVETATTTATATTTMTFMPQPIVARLLKYELTEFQCAVAVVAYESVDKSVSKLKRKASMQQMVLGDEEKGIVSQIRVLLEGSDRRYRELYLNASRTSGSDLVVSPLYSPNRGTKVIAVGKQQTTSRAHTRPAPRCTAR